MAEAFFNLASVPRDKVYEILNKSVEQVLYQLTDDQLLAFIKRAAQDFSSKEVSKKVA
ncbi:MAG: hypothetical protein ACKO0Z_05240 [Betaproteobacteria bacterium]